MRFFLQPSLRVHVCTQDSAEQAAIAAIKETFRFNYGEDTEMPNEKILKEAYEHFYPEEVLYIYMWVSSEPTSRGEGAHDRAGENPKGRAHGGGRCV